MDFDATLSRITSLVAGEGEMGSSLKLKTVTSFILVTSLCSLESKAEVWL